jgi:ABC-type branched-subunit amino acid transport system ATPase component
MIEVEDLVKQFGARRAVNGVSFSVERGEVPEVRATGGGVPAAAL